LRQIVIGRCAIALNRVGDGFVDLFIRKLLHDYRFNIGPPDIDSMIGR
jgi:hypothetical protein